MFPKEPHHRLLLAASLWITLASSSELTVQTPHSEPRNGAPDHATAVHDFRRNSEREQDQIVSSSCPGLRSGRIKGRDMTSDDCKTGSSVIADHNLAFGFPTNSTDWRECLPHYPAEK